MAGKVRREGERQQRSADISVIVRGCSMFGGLCCLPSQTPDPALFNKMNGHRGGTSLPRQGARRFILNCFRFLLWTLSSSNPFLLNSPRPCSLALTYGSGRRTND
ncbi:unnamed protein product, partial [Scytosiphon promiscuus]